MTESDYSAQPSRKIVLRRRPSRWTRLLFLFGVLSTSLVLFCCAGMIVLRAIFGPTYTSDAVEVEAIAHHVASMQAPPGFEAAEGLSGDNSLFWLQIARFDQIEGRGQLVIGEVRMRPLPANNDFDVPRLKDLIDEIAPELRLLDVKATRELIVTIRGKKVPFEIVEGEDRASTTRLRQVTGSFPGLEGPARLIAQAQEEFLSDEAIDNLLNSLAETP